MNRIIDINKAAEYLNDATSSSKFQHMLIRMLQEEENSSIVEWVDGKIAIHHPKNLESITLKKYFNHSKYTSFQRQLNNFGFRKIRQVQKGKYEPCFYVNESTTSDIQSIMGVKKISMRKHSTKKSKIKSDTFGKVKFQEQKLQEKSIVLVFDTPPCNNSDCKCCSILNEMRPQ